MIELSKQDLISISSNVNPQLLSIIDRMTYRVKFEVINEVFWKVRDEIQGNLKNQVLRHLIFDI
jgi:hypothetical protein